MREPEHQDPVRAARDVAKHSLEGLRRSVAFRQLPVSSQAAILGDLGSIQRTFATAAGQSPMAESLVGPRPHLIGGGPAEQPQPAAPQPGATPSPRQDATATLAGRTGALSDEVNFPAFVAGLIHGTFDAMVDASIRQMETYADLISSVARSIDDFTRDNVSRTQVIDWLAERYPKDLVRTVADGTGEPQLGVRSVGDEEGEQPSPAWLSDYGLEGEPLTDELIEQELIPAAQRRVGEGRMKSLATMVLLGLNRIVVRDGTISAHVRFRAAAKDRSKVVYETGQPSWGERGSSAAALPATMVSTVGVNVQAESELRAELFGEVKINFASETMPLDRFADAAQVTLLETHAKRTTGRNGTRSVSSEVPAPPTPPPAPGATAPATGPAAAVAGGTA